MPVKNFLTKEQKINLQNAIKESTAARLSEHLEKETGIKLSSEQVRRTLKEKKYVYHWAKYSLEDKQNPEKREAFKDKISGYLEASKQEPKKIQVWFFFFYS